MRPYVAIVHKDIDSAYGVTFPDAPGCFSAADEIDDLFANAAEALELWSRSMAESDDVIAEPRDLSVLQRDPAWAESFASADLVIAIPAPNRSPALRVA